MAEVKPPCPNCDQGNAFVYWDDVKHRYFCWKNPAKQKYGCGHIWAPYERPAVVQSDVPTPPPQKSGPPPAAPAAAVTRVARPQGVIDLPQPRPCVVYTDAGPLTGRLFVSLDANNNLRLQLDGKTEVLRYWNRIEFE